MDLRVKDVMTVEVVTLRPEETVSEALALLLRHGIGGAPVVDDDGRVVGMLSESDLAVEETHLPLSIFSVLGAMATWPPSVRRFEGQIRKAMGAKVGDVMSRSIVSCGPEASVEEAAALLYDHHLRRFPVIAGDRLVGIVGRADVLGTLSAPKAPAGA